MSGLGRHLREARRRRQLSQVETAQRAEVRTDWLSRVEGGGIKKPGQDRLKKVAKVLGLDPLDVLELADQLDPEDRLRIGEQLDVEGSVEADPRLTERQRRLLIELYREFVGGSTGDRL